MDKDKKTSSKEKMGMKKKSTFFSVLATAFLDCWGLWLYSQYLQGFWHLSDQDVS